MTHRIVGLLLMAAMTVTQPVGAQTREAETTDAAPSGPRIEQAVLVRLVRTILIAVNNANLTGNYTVLRDLGSPSFAAGNTAATLAERFKPLREGRVDLSPILVLPINLARPPQLDPDGRLDIEGSVPTRPLLVSFRMRFEPVDGSWRLSDLAIGLNAAEDPDQLPADAGETEQVAPPSAATAPESEAEDRSDTEAPQNSSGSETGAATTPSVPLPTPKPDVE